MTSSNKQIKVPTYISPRTIPIEHSQLPITTLPRKNMSILTHLFTLHLLLYLR